MKNNKETPFERGNCSDCKFLYSAVNWWCGNKEAIEARGTAIPGINHCPYWAPKWRYIPKKYKTEQYGYVSFWKKVKRLFAF